MIALAAYAALCLVAAAVYIAHGIAKQHHHPDLSVWLWADLWEDFDATEVPR